MYNSTKEEFTKLVMAWAFQHAKDVRSSLQLEALFMGNLRNMVSGGDATTRKLLDLIANAVEWDRIFKELEDARE